jgi:CHAT domain-containing protein
MATFRGEPLLPASRVLVVCLLLLPAPCAGASGSSADQARDLKERAGSLVLQGRRAEALPLLEEALRVEDVAGRPAADRADVLEAIGVLRSETNEGEKALVALEQAEALLAGRAEPSRLLRLRINKADAYAVLGRYEEALALFAAVETDARAAGDAAQLARALCGGGEILQKRGRLDDAQGKFEEALALERRDGRHDGQARALNRLAEIDLARGQYDQAFARFEEARTAAGAAADPKSYLTSVALGTSLFQMLNREDQSFARLNDLGAMAGQAIGGNRPIQGLLEIMRLFSDGRLEEALQQTDRAIDRARQAGSRPGEEKLLVIRAALLFLLDRPEEALRSTEAALALSRDLGDLDQEAQVYFLAGYLRLRARRYDEARASLEQALHLERAIGSSGPRAVTLWALGAALELQGEMRAAIAAYRESAEISEAGFAEIRADDLLAGLAERASSAYGRWARLLALQGDAAQSFEVAERARARTFLRRLGNPPTNPGKAVDPALLDEERRLREKLQSLTQELRAKQRRASSASERLALVEMARQIDNARRDYGNLRIRLQQASPEYASLVAPSPLTVSEVQKHLDGTTVLIEYLLLEDESLAWVIDRDSIHVVQIPESAAEIGGKVEELRQRIAARQPIAKQSFLLYVILFGRLEPFLHHPNVLVVPHGDLHALPFAALTPDAGRTWLVDRYALSVLPSASVLPFLQAERSRPGDGMLALGDPDGSLPAAAEEARAVAGLFGTKALVGREASTAAVRNAPRPLGYLHIAAHAAFDPARPLFSRIRLADGDLAVHDVFGLDLRGTRLVVLSGCETDAASTADVGELESLSRAFLYAGAPAVVATQWAVDDQGSRALMEAFYRRVKTGTPTAEALRQAQRELLHGDTWSDPFFWAAFTLTGSPGAPSP